ncbi:unnamed protein product [Lactuca saligna]|uniref:Uncharacterized protein n=1 Tax=Lactuca saligna TaxID=75948 RepID=A0AA36EK98_LACSI|nr:unnamed protein product [Lactuca saligna]
MFTFKALLDEKVKNSTVNYVDHPIEIDDDEVSDQEDFRSANVDIRIQGKRKKYGLFGQINSNNPDREDYLSDSDFEVRRALLGASFVHSMKKLFFHSHISFSFSLSVRNSLERGFEIKIYI